MKILYFSRDYTTHDRRFLLKFTESSHDIFYLRLEDDGIPYEKRPLPKAIQQVNWSGGKQAANSVESWLVLMPDFEAVLADVQPDLVHAGPVQSCGFMTALVDFHPFLVMSWGSDILVDADQNPAWQWITRYTLNRSDLLLCDNQAVRHKVQSLVTYPDEKISQFPWGIDLKKFSPDGERLSLREQNGWHDKFIILSTRSWEEIYGIDILLEAFRLAYQQNPKLRLVLLGTGSLAPKIERYIVEHQLQKLIFKPGMVSHEELPVYYRSVDLYMSSTYSDGTSISLLEAMATGLPVVVTDGLGNHEWVVDNVNGRLASAGEPESFAQCLLEIANLSVSEREAIGRQNRQIAMVRADWDKNFDKLLNTYEDYQFG